MRDWLTYQARDWVLYQVSRVVEPIRWRFRERLRREDEWLEPSDEDVAEALACVSMIRDRIEAQKAHADEQRRIASTWN